MSDLQARIEALGEERRKLLAMRLRDVLADTPVADEQQPTGRLIAYAVARAPAATDAEELRAHLARRLPEYMVPSAVVFLDSLPRTATGKIDRRALPEPNTPESVEDLYVAPRSQTERRLAEIWAETLGFDEVGVRDNFFEMGGDSLLSIRIIARAAQAGIVITPEQFVESPTIEALAAASDAKASSNQPESEQAREAPGDSNAAKRGTFTPSDFPLADLDQSELDHVSNLISNLGDE